LSIRLSILAGGLVAVALTAPPPEARAEESGVRVIPRSGLKVETAALLLSGQEGGPLTFVAHAFGLPGPPGRARVPVVIEVDGSALLAAAGAAAGAAAPPAALRLELYVYAVGSQGLLGFLARTLEVDLARHQATLASGGLRAYAELELPPGDLTLRILLRATANGALGLRSLPVSVPDLGAGGPRLLALLAGGGGPWVEAGSPPPDLAGPLAARALAATAGEAVLRLVGTQLPAGAEDARLELRAGAVQAERSASISGRAAGPPGVETLTLTWRPGDLEPGLYEARARIGPDLASPPIEVVVVPPAAAEAWPQLLPGREQRRSAPAARAVVSGQPSRLSRRRLEQELRAALARLVQNQADGVAALASLELGLLQSADTAPDDLAATEQKIYSRLVEDRPEALVPLLSAYETIFRDAQRERTYLLATYAREMVHRLASLYAERAESPEARSLAARFLSLIGGTLSRSGPGGTLAERSFRRAYDLDPGNATVIHFLAMGAELRGDYRDALLWLERLERLPGEAAVARLRIAVNRRRLGEENAALRGFRALLDQRAEEWVTAVAFQETVRLLVAREQYAEAEQVLRQGLQRLPHSEKLHLQLALVLDLKGEAPRARELVAGLDLPLPGGRSERYRYGQLPYERVESERRALEAAASSRLDVLAAALGRSQADEAATP
jgi:hypothetical protein